MSYYNILLDELSEYFDEIENGVESNFLSLVLKDITVFDWERRHFHDRDGFFAERTWTEKCLALGHVEPLPPEGEEWYDPCNDDELYMDGTHGTGWDGDFICLDTRNGVACTYCESEDCPFMYDPPSIWGMPGVRA